MILFYFKLFHIYINTFTYFNILNIDLLIRLITKNFQSRKNNQSL